MFGLKFVLILISMLGLSSCVTQKYDDLSHYELLEYKNENYCKGDFQCKVIGYGVGNTCGPTWEGGVAGYIIYSTIMGRDNIRHLKELAELSKVKGPNNKFDYSRLKLEECLSAQKLKPIPRCIEQQCVNEYEI